MGMEEKDTRIKKMLRSLCLGYGWSYGVFWRFDPRNHMLLTMEDAYYEEHAGSLVASMLLQVHMLGEGMIGQAALDGKYRWMFIDGSTEKCKLINHAKGQDRSSDDSEVGLQLSSGIKTVAVIPVEMRGVVQFGSTKEILETPEFLVQSRKFLEDKDSMDGIAPAASGSMILSHDSLYEDMPASFTDMADEMGSCLMFAEQSASLLDPCQVDDLSQWLAELPEQGITEFDALLPNHVSRAMGVDSLSSGPSESEIFCSILGKQPANSLQSCLSNDALDSCGKGRPLDFPANNDEILTQFGIDLQYGELGEGLEGFINPVIHGKHPLPIGISEVEGGSLVAPRKGLFSELGLEQLLRDGGSSCSSVSKSCIDEQWPASKKRRTDAYQTTDNQFQLTASSWGRTLMQPEHSDSHFGCLKECMKKSRGGSWVDDMYSMDTKSCITGVSTQTRRPEEPTKAAKKRARPGESTRPRPKDRQMFADCIKELRDIVPNGGKLSIDALLGRTVKHMIFLQNLTKHADKLKQVHEPKLIGQDNDLVQNGCSTSICSGGGSGRGATWAYEVGGPSLFCPIIVEDLSHPGQMLIEMLCEEREYFMEIAEAVRGFGLTILKGVMEARDDKIWAQFIVEGNRHITRMDVFVSLLQLLQDTAASEVNTSSEPAKAVNSRSPIWSNYNQHLLPLPI